MIAAVLLVGDELTKLQMLSSAYGLWRIEMNEPLTIGSVDKAKNCEEMCGCGL